MVKKGDIATYTDIKKLVDYFYDEVRKDMLIGTIFNRHIKGKWDIHHKKLYRFWATVLLRTPGYYGTPVSVHFGIGLEKNHFKKWLDIWCNTVDTLFEGKVADRAKHRGETMAAAFMEKIRQADADK